VKVVASEYDNYGPAARSAPKLLDARGGCQGQRGPRRARKGAQSPAGWAIRAV